MLARLRPSVAASLIGALLLAAAPATAQSNDEPLPRFEDAICPGIAGLEVEAAEAMVARIRDNLAGFGRRLAPAGTCEPNLVVLFVADSRAFVERLSSRNPWMFADPAARAATLGEAGPARAVVQVVPRTRDGQPIPRREDLVSIPSTGMWMAHSKIYTATRNDIVSAMILFDREAVKGTTIGQLADYATLRALTRVLPQTAAARGASILGLFDAGGEPPEGLTDFDRTYLAELYAGAPNIPGKNRLAALENATGLEVFVE